MSGQLCTVESCYRPVADAFVCQSCADELRGHLAKVPMLSVELENSRARQVRFGDPIGARYGGGRGLPFDMRASETVWVLRSTLVGWVRVFLEETNTVADAIGTRRSTDLPTDTVPGLASWLVGKVEWFRHHEAGGEAVEEIAAAVRLAEAVIDRPAERWYAGPCDDCQLDMYARTGVVIVTCACGASYDVAQRRDWLLDSVVDVLATATEIARALTSWETPMTSARIRTWRARGQIVPHAHTAEGWPLYRIGDVLELMEKPRGAALSA